MTEVTEYTGLSRYTDPGVLASMLAEIPYDIDGICAVAAAQTVHHNLRAALDARVGTERRVWPPSLEHVLRALAEWPPGALSLDRHVANRVLGACVLEAHFLAGLLRHRGYAVRIRAGYFQGIRSKSSHVVAFWNRLARWKGVEPVDDYTQHQNAVDHHIEHWLCEVWEHGAWRLLDANTDFLRYHSDLAVPSRLPPRHFEFAHQAWTALRSDLAVPEDRYMEDPWSGREHVRRQVLNDFFSLLNHDVPGVDQLKVSDDTIDASARVIAEGAKPDQLIALYRARPELHLEAAERDPYCFLGREVSS